MDPYLGEIRLFPWDFAPRGWALCQGQLLPVQQNAALFSLLGVMYGGNGSQTFGLPDLRGRTPVGASNTLPQGAAVGSETVTLTVDTMPAHNHAFNASTAVAAFPQPIGRLFGSEQAVANLYAPLTNPVVLAPQSIGTAGGSQPHPNMQPYTTLNYCIAVAGIFPSRS